MRKCGLLAFALLFAALGAARAQHTAPGGPDRLISCAYNSVLPTILSGNQGLVQCDANGRLIISNPSSGGGGVASQTASNAADGQATSTTNQQAVTWNYLFNGTTWDRMRGTNGYAGVFLPNNSASSPLIDQLVQGNAPLSSTNGLPTTDTNASQTITAPGTAAAKSQSVQGSDGQPLARDGTDNSVVTNPGGTGIRGWLSNIYNKLATFITVRTDQTTHGTTDKVAADLYVGGAPNATGNPALTQAVDVRTMTTLSLTTAGNVALVPVPQGASSFSFTTSGLTGSGAGLTVNVSSDSSNFATALLIGTNYSTSIASTSPITADSVQSQQIAVGGLQYVQFVVATAGTGTVTINYTFSAAAPRSVLGLGTSPTPGGVNSFSRIPSSAASTNLTQAKATYGRLYKIVACNTTTTPFRIKFYNALSANVTVGTTAVAFSRPVPAASAAGGLNCVSYDMADIGWTFGAAISYALTQGAADTDTTVLTAGQATDVSVEYK